MRNSILVTGGPKNGGNQVGGKAAFVVVQMEFGSEQYYLKRNPDI
jgi:hypothetical protein